MSLHEEGGTSLQAAVDVTNAIEATTTSIQQGDPAFTSQTGTASTSGVSVSPVSQAETLYLMDQVEIEHVQKKRQLELQVLEEQITGVGRANNHSESNSKSNGSHCTKVCIINITNKCHIVV